ncbi:MAG TPA: hypothetical protein DCE41_37135 [Cytophagales bacterium]|nr:hypothetical protein [Cytophagales bacterium]
MIFAAMTACDSIAEPEVILGTWTLTEQLTDPGDGSGEFQAVESDFTITFHENGSFSTNGALCTLTTGTVASSGIYDEASGALTVSNCRGTWEEDITNLSFDFRPNGTVEISFPCIEPCKGRFTKAE